MPPFNTKITGHDVPLTGEEWDDLTADELCVFLNRDGMLTSTGRARASYIRNHIAMVRANNQGGGTAIQVNNQVNISSGTVITDGYRADPADVAEAKRHLIDAGLKTTPSATNGNGNGSEHGHDGNGATNGDDTHS